MSNPRPQYWVEQMGNYWIIAQHGTNLQHSDSFEVSDIDNPGYKKTFRYKWQAWRDAKKWALKTSGDAHYVFHSPYLDY